jgi:hypothetical protein
VSSKPKLSLDNQNKNVRFILLFVFFFVNLFGAAALTYGASISQGDGVDGVSQSFNSFVEIYMVWFYGYITSDRLVWCNCILCRRQVHRRAFLQVYDSCLQ